MSSHLRFTTDRYWVGLHSWSKGLTSVILVAGVVCLAPQAVRQATEHVWLARAARAPGFSPKQVGLLTNAFAVEPMNAETALAIGEAYRIQSSVGQDNYQQLATQALYWLDRSMKLNPWDGRSALRYGMCLDWLGRPAESGTYFSRADQLEPNNYLTAAYIGWHYFNLGDYAAAKPWFERSLRLNWGDNPIAHNYLQLANSRLLNAATNDLAARLDSALR